MSQRESQSSLKLEIIGRTQNRAHFALFRALLIVTPEEPSLLQKALQYQTTVSLHIMMQQQLDFLISA